MAQRCVIYARYSSSGQREESIEGQIRVCKQFAKEHDLIIMAEYCDRAMTGRNDKRPELQRMIADSNSRLFDFVLVWKGDRIARNRDDKAFIRRKLRDNGVRILSAMEKVPTSPEGIILQSVLDGMDEYYSANLSSNVKRGMLENALKGKYNGSHIPFGYLVDESRHLVPNPNTASVVPIFFQMMLDGYSLSDLITYAKNHGIKRKGNSDFTYGIMNRLLSNRIYIGVYVYKGEDMPVDVPPLVSEELFHAVQPLLKTGTRKASRLDDPEKVHQTFLLSGKLSCGQCGCSICGDHGTSKNGVKHYYYTCITKKKGKRCDTKSIRQPALDRFVIDAVTHTVLQEPVMQLISDSLYQHQKSIEAHSPITILKHREKAVSSSIDNLLDLAATMPASSRLSEKLNHLESELSDIQNQISKEKLSTSSLTLEQISFWLHQVSSGYIKNDDFQQMLVHTFLNNIIVGNERIDMIFNFCKNQNKITFIEKRDLIKVYPCSDNLQMADNLLKNANIYLYHNTFIVQLPFSA